MRLSSALKVHCKYPNPIVPPTEIKVPLQSALASTSTEYLPPLSMGYPTGTSISQ